jgi:prefoldin subunit 5
MEEATKFSYNGSEFNLSEVSDKARYYIRQIEDLRKQHDSLRVKLDQVSICEQSFSEMLGEELDITEDVVEEEE